MKKSFKQDFRDINPGLHALYSQTAIMHLLAIDRMIIDAHSYSNMNMNGVIAALYREKAKLVKENAAYAEATDFLERLAERKLISRRGDCFLAYAGEDE